MTSSPVRYLVLWLTTACNMRCSYCYRGEQPPFAMPLDTADAALQLAAASGLPFHVQLAGGEPTLEPQLIAGVAERVRSAGWPATLALQTNATLLDEDLIELCRRLDIAVGVSIDGPPAVQEKARGSAAAAFRGLQLLARKQTPVRVTAVLTSANVLHLDELILSLLAFPNVRGFGLDPLVQKGAAAHAEGLLPSPEQVRAGVGRALAMIQQANRLRVDPLRWRELDLVRDALAGRVDPRGYCHACRGESLAVHPTGTVYPCGQTVGDRQMAVGTVEDVDWLRLRDVYRSVRLQGDCTHCPLLRRCPGDCPSRLTYNGAISPPVMCVVYRTIAEFLGARSSSTAQLKATTNF